MQITMQLSLLPLLLSLLPLPISSSTLALLSTPSPTLCAILTSHSILCVPLASPNTTFSLPPNSSSSYSSLSSSPTLLCSIQTTTSFVLCWTPPSFSPKRIYPGPAPVRGLSLGADHIAALQNHKNVVFWRRNRSRLPRRVDGDFESLTSGDGFSCAILVRTRNLKCWGRSGPQIESQFGNFKLRTAVAGGSHLCGFEVGSGGLVCRGSNSSGQIGVSGEFGDSGEFGSVSLGEFHTCAVKRANGGVVCWGGGGGGRYDPIGNVSVEVIVAGVNFTCGVMTVNFSVVCWSSSRVSPNVVFLNLPPVLPGICSNMSECFCGFMSGSGDLCAETGVICKACDDALLPPPVVERRERKGFKSFLAFAVVGSVGTFAGICAIVFFIVTAVCKQKVHNSVQPTIIGGENNNNVNSPFSSPSLRMRSRSWSGLFLRQGSRVMRRQRSGPSTSRNERAEEFRFKELEIATNGFAADTRIGAGSFGTVYKGKLPDGREVAVKRSESEPRTKRFQEKETAFQSELAFLSRLHHKHLVGLVGYCEENEERLLVYEFMKNGSLYDHIHSIATTSGFLDSWKMRIKVLLDASRGIEYLHSYAVPPIIHRDIKSSNILLDANWTARVSDFGLSLPDGVHPSAKAAGTVGYMDPEYYGLHHLTAKSDVYGLGVVMLEVLTGKRAVFKDSYSGDPISVVDFAVPRILEGEMDRVLDPRVGPPGPREVEAVELVAYTAVHCVRMEGRERPGMADVVVNLENAVALCDQSSNGSISSASMSLTSHD